MLLIGPVREPRLRWIGRCTLQVPRQERLGVGFAVGGREESSSSFGPPVFAERKGWKLLRLALEECE